MQGRETLQYASSHVNSNVSQVSRRSVLEKRTILAQIGSAGLKKPCSRSQRHIAAWVIDFRYKVGTI
jgi:hypothetical protein